MLDGQVISSPAVEAVGRPVHERRSLTPLLLLGYFLTIGVGCAQVYFLVRAITGVSESSDLSYWQSVIIAFFFFFFSVFFIGRYLVTMLFAFLEGSKRVNEWVVPETGAPLVSIIIPAYNEADNIVPTIVSALAVDYPALEIIVIDDGSTDETLQRARDWVAGQSVNVQVVSQANAGKAAALNYGYRLARGEYILSMDADSELDEHSVKRLVARICESGAAAVAGQVLIKNTRSMLSYLQQLEYVLMNGTGRLFQSFFSAVLVAPGPITLFSRSALERTMEFRATLGFPGAALVSGPWETSTFAEDAKLSMTMLASGENCVFEPSAVCLTQAPTGLSSLLNQRYRWIRGNLQAVKSTWALWTRASSRRPGLGLWLVWFIIESLLWPLVDVFGAIVIVLVLANTSAFNEGFLWYLALMSADVAAALFAATACQARRRLALLVPFYRLGYGLVLECVALISIIDESRRSKMTWS
ncbi:MAG: glycosyltransferase family 2 protein [Halieaceae bacterium]|uniref:glycosyltransferase family 2 protein n=1 Tax=Haliea alexandrii TaxID=2448162 RepID=UPI001304DA80|nr:glycosyltransferase family 2 protein [Haliea alexandrii]MCR9186532.1 glycosyltransferase family 2 protein [Halieaceae bacterium]